jgi:predicted MFS family arabinose efflux permease
LFFQGIASVTGCIVAAVMMDNLHPRWAYLFYAFVALIVAISCIFLNGDAEIEVIDTSIIENVSDYSSVYIDG